VYLVPLHIYDISRSQKYVNINHV